MGSGVGYQRIISSLNPRLFCVKFRMDLAMRLDPSEVLEHLRQLGYTGITPAQLKAFMNDLKKLIIHEQVMSSSMSSSGNDSTSLSISPSGSFEQTDSSYTASSCISEPEEIPSSCISESHTSGYERLYPGKENSNLKKAWSASSSDLKPKSSFIRPWNLGSRQTRSARSDPVSLYHHYKSIWEQQKFPGENDHANLRWLIRERMLGQDPHPTTQNTLRPATRNFRL